MRALDWGFSRPRGPVNTPSVNPPSTTDPGASPQAHFVTTRWSMVLRAGQTDTAASREALEKLCRAYWFPLYAFARREGCSPEESQDLTQEFFCRLLEKNSLQTADPARGRFRSFLLASFKNLMTNEWRRSQRQKRGGGAEVFSLDHLEAEDRYAIEPADDLTPEKVFERRWAEALLARVLERLRLECDGDGPERARRFEIVKVFLLEDKGTLPLADAAAQLGLSVVATKGLVHRLRTRYRDIFREEIEHTVASPDEVEDEIRHLFAALG
jgi:RNA polymerase sigma factor (sigma-70 family)